MFVHYRRVQLTVTHASHISPVRPETRLTFSLSGLVEPSSSDGISLTSTGPQQYVERQMSQMELEYKVDVSAKCICLRANYITMQNFTSVVG